MLKTWLVAFVLGALVSASFSYAANGNVTSCESGKDKRTLELKEVDGGCSLNYTKAGSTKEVGKANHGKAVCEKAADKILNNLKKAGFKCS